MSDVDAKPCPFCKSIVYFATNGMEQAHVLKGVAVYGNIKECETHELRKLCDDLIAVANKLGSGMPILSDPVVMRAHELKRALG